MKKRGVQFNFDPPPGEPPNPLLFFAALLVCSALVWLAFNYQIVAQWLERLFASR